MTATMGLKAGQLVVIFEDPITMNKREGQATLIRNTGGSAYQKGLFIERWDVQFMGEDEPEVNRSIMVCGDHPATREEVDPDLKSVKEVLAVYGVSCPHCGKVTIKKSRTIVGKNVLILYIHKRNKKNVATEYCLEDPKTGKEWKRKKPNPKTTIDFGNGKKCTFTKGGRKAFEFMPSEYGGDGWYMINADIKLADGTKLKGLVELSMEDSGEHYGTSIWTPSGKLLDDHDQLDELLGALGKTRAEFFPYSYRYTAKHFWDQDHHVGDDGWSR